MSLRRIQGFIVSLACLAVMACGSGAGGTAIGHAVDISESDFLNAVTTKSFADELDAELAVSDYLTYDSDMPRNLMSGVTMGGTLGLACAGLTEPVFTKNADNTFRYEFAFDATSCLSSLSAQTQNSISSEQITGLVVSGYLDNLILVDFEGTEVDVSGQGLLATLFLKPVQYNLKSLMIVTGPSGSFTTKTAVAATSDINAPCVFSDTGLDGCSIWRFTGIAASGFSAADVGIYHFNNIVYPATELSPYDSGSIDFTYNNWDGTVTYGGTPTYTATSDLGSTSGTL